MDKFRVEVKKKVEHSKGLFNSCFKGYKWRDFHVLPQRSRDVLSLHSGEEHKPSNWLQEEHTKKPQPVTYKISINWHSTFGSFLTRCYKKPLKSKIHHWNQLSSSELQLMFIIQHWKIRTDYLMKWRLAVGWSYVLSFGAILLLQNLIHGNLSFNVASRCPPGNLFIRPDLLFILWEWLYTAE